MALSAPLCSMSDDDSDEEDLWGDLEDDPDDNVMISSNLAALVGTEAKEVHKGEADEGQIRWVAPKFSGLSNSDTVDSKGTHWNHDEVESKDAAAKGVPQVKLTPSTATSVVAPPKAASDVLPTPTIATMPAAPTVPATKVVDSSPFKLDAAFKLPQGTDGKIDWNSLSGVAS